MATYRTCVADAKTQKQELEDTKVTVLRQIQEVIRQSDQTIKSVGAGLSPAPAAGGGEAGPPLAQPLTPAPRPRPQATISYYQMMHMQTAPLPVHFQMLCESSKLYDPGQQYASHVRQLQRDEEPDVDYDFEPHVSAGTWYVTCTRRGAGSPPDRARCDPRHGAPRTGPAVTPAMAPPPWFPHGTGGPL